MKKQPRKAVILLGFDSADPTGSAATSCSDNTVLQKAVQKAVMEALAAGLKELIFVTADSRTPVEAQVGSLRDGAMCGPASSEGACEVARPERVVIARQFAARGLGQALCEIRHLLEEEPFVVMLPHEMTAGGSEGSTAELIATFKACGGCLVSVKDTFMLEQDGCFAAIARAAAGRYLLQPAVLDVLEEDPEGGLSGALLLLAEAWPVTALPVPALHGGDVARQPAGFAAEADATRLEAAE